MISDALFNYLDYPLRDHPSIALLCLRLKLLFCKCSVFGTVAAVRLATSPTAIQDARQEAAIYERLEHLQGQCIPRLLAHGLTLEGSAYFVATEYIEVGLLTPTMQLLPAPTHLIHVPHSFHCSHDSSQDACALAWRLLAGVKPARLILALHDAWHDNCMTSASVA